MTAEGKPVEAPREKSFIEKYWMYIAIALVAMSTCDCCVLRHDADGCGAGRVFITVAAPAPAAEEGAGGRDQGSGGRR